MQCIKHKMLSAKNILLTLFYLFIFCCITLRPEGSKFFVWGGDQTGGTVIKGMESVLRGEEVSQWTHTDAIWCKDNVQFWTFYFEYFFLKKPIVSLKFNVINNISHNFVGSWYPFVLPPQPHQKRRVFTKTREFNKGDEKDNNNRECYELFLWYDSSIVNLMNKWQTSILVNNSVFLL